MSSPSPQSKAATTSSSNIANTVSASSSCPQSIVKSLSPLSLDEFEIVSSAASDIVDKLPNCHDNDRLIRRKSDGKLLVWKRIHYGSMDEQELKMLLSELMVVRQIRHPNIVEYVGRIVDEVKQDVYIVSEYCANGDLTGVIKKHIREGGGSSGGCSLSDYDVLCEIGTGSYGTCAKIRRKRDGLILVWKELSYVTMTEAEKRYLCSEVNLLKSLSHPNIVKYVDRIHDRATGKVYIIMEYCDGGDLLKRIRAHREKNYSPALRALIADCLAVTPEHRPSVEDLLQRPEMIPYSGSGAEESISPERGSLQSWADSLAKRESAVRRASAQLESARLDLKARQRSLSELEARLAARERALIDVERKLANGQAQLRFEQLRLAESAAVQRLDAATSTEPTISNGRPTCDRCSSCQQLPQFTTPDTPPPESVALSAPSATSFSAVSVGLPPPVVALNGRQRRSGASSTPTNSRKVQPDEQQSAAVRRPPIPAPRRSVLRDQANQLYC
uniref:non-specific serine/threonine protein kinase n=1 Tax=Macrostomum lignano TaxID=282301 RepID=A0A1I8FZ47_9PLAT